MDRNILQNFAKLIIGIVIAATLLSCRGGTGTNFSKSLTKSKNHPRPVKKQPILNNKPVKSIEELNKKRHSLENQSKIAKIEGSATAHKIVDPVKVELKIYNSKGKIVKFVTPAEEIAILKFEYLYKKKLTSIVDDVFVEVRNNNIKSTTELQSILETSIRKKINSKEFSLAKSGGNLTLKAVLEENTISATSNIWILISSSLTIGLGGSYIIKS